MGSVESTKLRGTSTAMMAVSTPGLSMLGETLTRRFASATRTTADDDATMLFSFFVPRDDASWARVLASNTGDVFPIADVTRAAGSWVPIGPRNPAGPFDSDASPIDHTLTAKSIAVQESASSLSYMGVFISPVVAGRPCSHKVIPGSALGSADNQARRTITEANWQNARSLRAVFS